MTASLCLCEKEYFAHNYGAVMVLLQKLVRAKGVGLDLVRLLLDVYLIRCSDPSDAPVVAENLQTLSGQLFSSRKPILSQDYANEFVDIICVIAKTQMDFACKNIIFELLRGDNVIPE